MTQQRRQWAIQTGAGVVKPAAPASNTQLELEYKSVKQENAKLKEVITTLKQEIDLYSRVLSRSSGTGSSQAGAGAEAGMGLSMEALLVNPKRRKTLCVGSNVNQMRSGEQ